MYTRKSIVSWFLCSVLMFINCAPVPMIQSARIKGRVGLGFDCYTDAYNVTYVDRDTIGTRYPDTTFYGLRDDTVAYSQYYNARAYLRFPIKNRVELITGVIPFLFVNAVYGNLKVSLFDVGSEKLFHNISGAIFAGGSFVNGEWDRYTDQWGGVIAGTHTLLRSIDIEIVTMASLSHFKFHSTDEERGSKDMRFLIANLSPGVIVSPFKRHWLQMNAGCSLRYPISKYGGIIDYYHDLVSSKMIESKINPFVFQFGMMVCLPDKKINKAN